MTELSCGRISRQSISQIADRAARLLMERRDAMALCCDLEGRVTLETPNDAVPDEIVGCYHRGIGLLALWKQMAIDLEVTQKERGAAKSSGRKRVYAGRRRKEAA